MDHHQTKIHSHFVKEWGVALLFGILHSKCIQYNLLSFILFTNFFQQSVDTYMWSPITQVEAWHCKKNLSGIEPQLYKRRVVSTRIIFIITNTEGERDQIYRLGSFKFFPSKNSPKIHSRSSAPYLKYFWGFLPLSTRGL